MSGGGGGGGHSSGLGSLMYLVCSDKSSLSEESYMTRQAATTVGILLSCYTRLKLGFLLQVSNTKAPLLYL